jgi:hypothetical protein
MGQKASKSVAEEVDKTKEQIDAAYNVFKKAEEFQCREYDADINIINMKMLNVFILSFILFCIIIYIYLLFRTRKKYK